MAVLIAGGALGFVAFGIAPVVGSLGASSALSVVPPSLVDAVEPEETLVGTGGSSAPDADGGDADSAFEIRVTRWDWSPSTHRLALLATVSPAPSESATCEARITTPQGDVALRGAVSVDGGGLAECRVDGTDDRLVEGSSSITVMVVDGTEVSESVELPL